MTDASWIDADGTPHPGSPPPGFIQRPDRRWSPPGIAAPTPPPAVTPPTPPPARLDAEPFWQQPRTAPTGAAGAPTSPPPLHVDGEYRNDLAAQATAGAGGDDRSLLVLGGVVGAAFLVLLGTVAYFVTRDDADDVIGGGTTTVFEDDRDTTVGPTTMPDDGERASELPNTTIAPVINGDALADVAGCTRVDANTVNIEIISSATTISDYWLTVEFFGDDGTVIATEAAYFNHVRPGERLIENEYMFEERGDRCRVIDADRSDSWFETDRLGDVGDCLITGEDFAGDLTASIEVAHDDTEALDYSVALAFMNEMDIRLGEGNGFVSAVQPGEAAPTEVWTTVPADAGAIRCEVVGVNASPTEGGFGDDPEALAAVESCIVDGDSLTIRVRNDRDGLTDYWVSIVVYDDGQRVDDTTAFLSAVPPGVTAEEQLLLFESTGDECDAVSADANDTFRSGPTGATATCRVTGADSFDDVEGIYELTNNDAGRGDFTVNLGFYDDGVRKGSTVVLVEGVDAGATSSDEFITFVPFDPALSCQVDAIAPATP